MIRINLKKAEKPKSSPGTSKIDLKGFKNIKMPSAQLDMSSMVVLVIAIAVAALPQLFVSKYRAHVEAGYRTKVSALDSELERLKSEVTKYETLQAEMKSIEEQEARVSQRLNVVKQLQASRTGPLSMLDAIAQALPQRVWLSSIELSGAPSPNLQLNGRGYSSEDVAEFVDKLNSSIYFERVNLDGVSTERDGDQSGTVKAFLIMAVPKLGGDKKTVSIQ